MSWKAVRTVAVLELRQRVRSTRWKIMLALWGIVLALLCGGLTMLVVAEQARDFPAPMLYDITLGFVLLIGLIVAPTLSATSINGDRADATLALLQATALRPGEIVVGKLLAAWAAALAFLGVALPFLVVLTAAGGSRWITLLAHLIVLAIALGTICAVGLGFSATASRPSASSVLTYLVMAALVIGTPIATAISSTAVRGVQTTLVYETDYDRSTDSALVCKAEPRTYTHEVVHSDRIWWMLAPNPFAALGDVSARFPLGSSKRDSEKLFGPWGATIDEMRDPVPSTVEVRHCENRDRWGDDVQYGHDPLSHMAFWPASLALLMALGALPLWSATRRLRTPTRRLARGTRVA